MRNIAGILSFVLVINSCQAQVCRIQKAQAFYTVLMPGTQRADENGNPVDPEPIIERFIYIECRFNGKPKIDSVFYNGISFMASIEDKEEATLKIGIRREDGKPASFLPKKGNHVWKINLQQASGNTLKHAELKKIIVKGKLAKIKFSYILTSETELITPDRY